MCYTKKDNCYAVAHKRDESTENQKRKYGQKWCAMEAVHLIILQNPTSANNFCGCIVQHGILFFEIWKRANKWLNSICLRWVYFHNHSLQIGLPRNVSVALPLNSETFLWRGADNSWGSIWKWYIFQLLIRSAVLQLENMKNENCTVIRPTDGFLLRTEIHACTRFVFEENTRFVTSNPN